MSRYLIVLVALYNSSLNFLLLSYKNSAWLLATYGQCSDNVLCNERDDKFEKSYTLWLLLTLN